MGTSSPGYSPGDCSDETKNNNIYRDAQMKAILNQKLVETGEREQLQEWLRAKLIECDWKDQLQAHCRDVIQAKGAEHANVDNLVSEITPKGRALIPNSFKEELLQRVRTFLAQHVTP
ncbi:transcription and mRNA export factor ENY2-like [Antechinus flavipes]|uniref:transcription and mRNA export factor ENY2-like n=1 Tax=Antechinus flavipes TaxID=38775 RepID=UPI00223625B2|nr:transcription and mRNA export factor ENY2-like [Antechinus flavipes]XP_051846965.1 transcription and mRNA export factor ENY2-like [Antechinus flavipes]